MKRGNVREQECCTKYCTIVYMSVVLMWGKLNMGHNGVEHKLKDKDSSPQTNFSFSNYLCLVPPTDSLKFLHMFIKFNIPVYVV